MIRIRFWIDFYRISLNFLMRNFFENYIVRVTNFIKVSSIFKVFCYFPFVILSSFFFSYLATCGGEKTHPSVHHGHGSSQNHSYNSAFHDLSHFSWVVKSISIYILDESILIINQSNNRLRKQHYNMGKSWASIKRKRI